MVDRYVQDGVMHHAPDNGEWVKYDDYESEVEDLRAENERLREALEEIASYDTGATAGLAYTAKEALK